MSGLRDESPSAAALVEIQQRLLGWQLANAPGVDRWLGALRVASRTFGTPHDRIVEAIAAMREDGIKVDPRSAALELQNDPGLKEIGGEHYFAALVESAPKIYGPEEAEKQARQALREHRALLAENSVISAASFAGREIPKRQDLVSGLLPLRTVTILSGDGGTGKSLLALQLGAATSMGMSWLGKTVQRKAPVLFLSAEDEESELHRRLAAVTGSMDVGLDDLVDLHLCPLAGEDALLGASESAYGSIQPTPLFFAVENRIQALRPSLVVLDTLADFFGGNENDRGQARQFIGLLRGWAMRHDLAVLLLAHPSQAGLNSGSGTSGSTAWNNSVRSRLYFEREKDDETSDLRVLKVKKANYARSGEEIRLEWRDGVFLLPGASGPITSMIAQEKAERVFMEMLIAYRQEGRYVGPKKGHNFAPAVFGDDKKRAAGLDKRALADAMNRLFDKNLIRIEEDGPPSRRTHRLAPA